MNAGLAALMPGPYSHFLLLTQDAVLDKGALAALTEHLGSARVGVLAPTLASKETGRAWSYGGVSDNRGQVHHRRDVPVADGKLLEADWVDGACLVVARELLDDVGLFDDTFFLYFEEAELCLRARRAGWPVLIALDARAYQAPGDSKRYGAYEFLFTRNGMEYARRVGGWRAVLTSINVARIKLTEIARGGAGGRGSLRTRDGRARFIGIVLGTAAFLARRRGPPPPWLPGLGDIAFTAQPEGSGPASA